MTLAAASDGGPLRVIFGKKFLQNSRASHSCSVKYDPLPHATPGTLAVAWPCVKQRQHLLLQGLHPSSTGCRWFSGGPQVGEDSGRLRLSLRCLRTDDTLPLPTAVSPSIPLTRSEIESELALVFRDYW